MFNILDLTMFLAEKGELYLWYAHTSAQAILECTEASLPFNLVRELFECLSIPSCSQVFSWVERRGKRLCLVSLKIPRPSLCLTR
jgi:THO complex subunit 1 transcription elongation factor